MSTTSTIDMQAEKSNNELGVSHTDEPQIMKWRLLSLYISICLGLFLSFLDTSIVATAIYTIGVEFHSLSKVNWIALAYTLAYIGCTAILASLSDVFGRRNIYLVASILFLAFSLGCGFAQSLDQLIALRALQGVGGSGLYSVGFVILPEISSLKMMKMIGAIAGAVVAMSGILGPVLGGIITQYTTWRWIFWINGPVGLFQIILFAIAYPPANQLRPLQRRSIKSIDYLGFFLLIATSVPFVLSFQEAGMNVIRNSAVWSHAIFLAPCIVGVMCFIALFGWEWFIAHRWSETVGALLPMRLVKNRVYMSAVLSTLLTGFPYFVVIYSLPTRFQVVNGHTALMSGIALLPMLGASAIGSTAAGAASGKRNNTFPVQVIGTTLMVIGTATLSTLTNLSHAEARSYGLQVFIGFGFGLTVSNASYIAGMESEIRDASIGQGLVAQVRMLGGSIGIAASTAILGVKQRQQLLETGLLSPEQMQSLAETLRHLSPSQVFAVRQAYSDAFSQTLIVCSAIGGLAVLVSMAGWQRHPVPMDERRKQRFKQEAERQQRLRQAKVSSTAPQSAKGV